jgi:uncharacterized protein (TIGR02246 family)
MSSELQIKSELAAPMPLATGGMATATPADEAAIREIMSRYNEALNTSSVDKSLALYADDGVFMPPFSVSSIGKAAVREAYERVFKALTLNVTFTVAELVQMSPEWAFARTNSAGTNMIHATGMTSAEGNQELFIFRKDAEGEWKIARYSFSPTNQ